MRYKEAADVVESRLFANASEIFKPAVDVESVFPSRMRKKVELAVFKPMSVLSAVYGMTSQFVSVGRQSGLSVAPGVYKSAKAAFEKEKLSNRKTARKIVFFAKILFFFFATRKDTFGNYPHYYNPIGLFFKPLELGVKVMLDDIEICLHFAENRRFFLGERALFFGALQNGDAIAHLGAQIIEIFVEDSLGTGSTFRHFFLKTRKLADKIPDEQKQKENDDDRDDVLSDIVKHEHLERRERLGILS